MFTELLKSAAVLLVSFVVKYVFDFLGVALDEGVFNSIVAALVALFLSLFGVEVARVKVPRFFN